MKRPMRPRRSVWAGAWMLACTSLLVGCGEPADIEPNIVLIVVDDLGWVDTGVYGSTFYETPNIDRLAAEGARFTQFYAASPVCSPTRASIMTGKYPARVNITNWIGGEQQGRLLQAEYERELTLDEITLGDAFQAIGYATGYIGKWHLGGEPFEPEFQGFDLNIGAHHAGQPGSYFFPYSHERQPRFDVPDLEDGQEGEYLTDRLTNESLRFIEANQDRPFLLVLSHYSVHTPLQSKPQLTDKYRRKEPSAATGPAFLPEGVTGTTKQRQDHAVYAGMIQSTDESVGRILDALEELDLADRTIVVFVSDNGGLSTLMNGRTTAPTANIPLRAGKGWLYEGGIRSPLIVKWPKVVEAGSVVDEPAITNDLFPTLMELAEVPLTLNFFGDGRSLAPLLRGAGAGELNRDALYWHFPHYHGSGNLPSGAVRAGDFKLIEWFEDGRTELYDLNTDLGETTDLAKERPEKVEELLGMLRAWRSAVSARMPSPNPDWRPTEN